MFRFEHLHERWIQECTAYIAHLFGHRVRDAVVVDYAFGRGNWSVAFQRAGAHRVIAIDASQDNVRRFAQYCDLQRIDRIEVVHGNILDQPVGSPADIVWAYGILPHVPDPGFFLGRLRSLLRARDSLLYLYAYDKGSLREYVVSSARLAIPVLSEPAFRDLSYLFAPAARLRARDDLTAPHVQWHAPRQLQAQLRDNELYVVRQDADFPAYQHGFSPFPEFSPLQFLCTQDSRSAIRIEDATAAFEADIDVLMQITLALFSHHTGQTEVLKKFAIGLLNTHFSALDRKDARKTLVNDFLYLLYCWISAALPPEALGDRAQRIVQLGMNAVRGEPRPSVLHLDDGVLANYLMHNTVRI